MSNVDRRVNGFMNEEEGGSRVNSLGKLYIVDSALYMLVLILKDQNV